MKKKYWTLSPRRFACLGKWYGGVLSNVRLRKQPWQSPMAFRHVLTMIVLYGPAGGSGQVAAAMAEAVTGHTDVAINRDHKPGGSGTVGMTAYMAAPADGYNVLEHIDDAAHPLCSIPRPNPAAVNSPRGVSGNIFAGLHPLE